MNPKGDSSDIFFPSFFAHSLYLLFFVFLLNVFDRAILIQNSDIATEANSCWLNPPTAGRLCNGLHNEKFPLKSSFNQHKVPSERFLCLLPRTETGYIYRVIVFFYYIIKRCLRIAQICLAWPNSHSRLSNPVNQIQSGQSLCIRQQPVWLWRIRCWGRLFPSHHTFSPIIYTCRGSCSLELAKGRGWLVASIVGSNRLRAI